MRQAEVRRPGRDEAGRKGKGSRGRGGSLVPFSPLGPLYSPPPPLSNLILDFLSISLQACSLAWFTPEPSVERAATAGQELGTGAKVLVSQIRDEG